MLGYIGIIKFDLLYRMYHKDSWEFIFGLKDS